MTTNHVAVRDIAPVQTNGIAIAAFVLSLMGMYGSPLLSASLALVGLYQVRRREQNGFGLAIAALVVSLAVTALHVVMWIHCGHATFELLTTSHW
ncbi:DUF4190 domain-containing protein [Mycobacterium shigaense]|uniref:DUF4190 domain-containing protein n=1 Tax=Mycobacterium shigaense TaxID=722731 RepID=A0A1Z4EFI8_9MYCO|nr:DUF4190 domain-containing protein [Mycobacterium shigaense]MEA1124744.1 DUF4190 domain-containing protein [Mycobacterium shigaense]PRI16439.1 hypothetical protein B2J96_06585 [Mycobacterium shigaense]BAX91709.1 hypothetical protein MSG_01553 [Mycobacterium shigaense]